MKVQIFSIFLLVLLIGSCVKPTEYSVVPSIEFVSLNKNVLEFGIDTLVVTFSFNDGDGDIGTLPENQTEDTKYLKFYDSRITQDLEFISFSIPAIYEHSSGNGVSGEITSKIAPSNFICYVPGLEFQEFTLSFTIEDNAGNVSNTAVTPTIRLMCN